MWFVSFLTIALLAPFKAFLVSFFQLWGLNLGPDTRQVSTELPLVQPTQFLKSLLLFSSLE